MRLFVFGLFFFNYTIDFADSSVILETKEKIMNPQPEFLEVLPVTIGFCLMVLWFAANPKNHYKFSDKFTLAEWVDESPTEHPKPPPVPTVDVSLYCKESKKSTCTKKSNINASRKPSKQSKPTKSRNHNGYTDLQQDCFDALKSLGIKSVRERKYIVSKTFNEHDPKTIQEFLTITMSRSC
jgi:hypothetical protein